jgi:hypothetical protein
MLVAFFGTPIGNSTWSNEATANIAAGNWTEDVDSAYSTYSGIAISHYLQATAAATGASSATMSTNAINIGALVSLRPMSYTTTDTAGTTESSVLSTTGHLFSVSGVGTALLGLSFRRLDPLYSSYCLRAWKMGGTTQEVSFNSDGSLDTATLLSFAGSGDAYLTRWYRQDGSGGYAEQTDSAKMPKIVSSGAMVTDLNGAPSAYFDGGDCMTVTGVTLHANLSIFVRAQVLSSGMLVEQSANANDNPGFYFTTTSLSPWFCRRTTAYYCIGTTDWFVSASPKIGSAIFNTSGATYYLGTTAQSNGTITGTMQSDTTATDTLNIGSRNNASVAAITGYVNEIVIWDDVDQSSYLSNIVANMLTAWPPGAGNVQSVTTTDTAASTESSIAGASTTTSDSAGSTESAAISGSISAGTDASGSSESSTVDAGAKTQDTAESSESASVTAGATTSDTAGSSETATAATGQSATVTDSAASTESALGEASGTVADSAGSSESSEITGEGVRTTDTAGSADSAAAEVSTGTADAGASSESSSISGSISAATDAAGTTESGNVSAASTTTSDAGASTEGATSGGSISAGTDNAGSSESAAASAAAATSDSGGAAESSSAAGSISAGADIAGASESVTGSASTSKTDTGATAENVAASGSIASGTDTAGSAEGSGGAAAVSTTDTATSSETSTAQSAGGQAVTVSDSAGTTESSSASASTSSADTAGTTEQAAGTVGTSAGDSAGSSEGVAGEARVTTADTASSTETATAQGSGSLTLMSTDTAGSSERSDASGAIGATDTAQSSESAEVTGEGVQTVDTSGSSDSVKVGATIETSDQARAIDTAQLKSTEPGYIEFTVTATENYIDFAVLEENYIEFSLEDSPYIEVDDIILDRYMDISVSSAKYITYEVDMIKEKYSLGMTVWLSWKATAKDGATLSGVTITWQDPDGNIVVDAESVQPLSSGSYAYGFQTDISWPAGLYTYRINSTGNKADYIEDSIYIAKPRIQPAAVSA